MVSVNQLLGPRTLLMEVAGLAEKIVAREVLNLFLGNWLGESGFSEVDRVFGM